MPTPKTKKDTETLNGHIGANIRKLREERKLSQAQVAEMVGVSLYALQEVEQGLERVMPALLHALMGVFDVSYSDFFVGT